MKNLKQTDGQPTAVGDNKRADINLATLATKQAVVGLLSRAEVAQRLGVCSHSIQRLTRRGKLPVLRFNSRLLRYDPAVVEAFIRRAR